MRKSGKRTERSNSHQKTVSGNWRTQLGYYMMFAVPALWMFLMSYVPLTGIYLAFVDYKPAKGIFGSKFVGLKHFKDFFSGYDFVRVFRNTIAYNVGTMVIVGLFCGILFAVLLYEIKSRVANKIFHTCMLLPAFISWTVVSAALMVLLQTENGMVNQALEILGLPPVSWYRRQEYWPAIIIFAKIYKMAGMSSIYFYSSLLSINTELFDAANIDGANRIKQIWHISLPAMSKVFCITLINSLGGILSGGISPYYELTFNNGELYETTLVLGTYLYNGLADGRYSFSTAVGVVQSLIGLVLVVVSNMIVKRIDPESALF